MKLNHLNLTVTDIQSATNFLVKYFGMRDMGANGGMGFLTDDDNEWGFVLTLMKVGEETQGKYPSTFHIGFFVESEKSVDEINRRLKEDGYDVPDPTRNNHAY